MADNLPELLELARQFLPAYLFPGAREQLLEAINSFPHRRGYFADLGEPDYLQGDCWTNFTVYNFETGDRKSVTGLILSNSCDVNPGNRTGHGERVVFVPLIRLAGYVDLLRQNGRTEEQVASTVDRVMRQHADGLFYLPAHGQTPDSVALLDNVHSEPLQFLWAAEKSRVIRLSDFGFWLFTLKLSIHFTRLREMVQRGAVPDA